MARIRLMQQAPLLYRKPWTSSRTLASLTAVSPKAGLVRPLNFVYSRNLSTSSILNKYQLPEIPPEDEPFIVKSPYTDVEVPEANLADYVWKDIEKWPENTALVSS